MFKKLLLVFALALPSTALFLPAPAGAQVIQCKATTSAQSSTLYTNNGTGSVNCDRSGAVRVTGTVTIGGVTLGANDGVDIGDVTINNASGGSAVNIQDGGNTITVDGTVAIGAGSAVIGHVIADSGSTTAVTQATASNLNATVVGTGTFAVQPAGSVAHDGVGTAVNPTLTGCYASAAVPSDVSTDGDATRTWCLRSGALANQVTFGGVLASTGTGASGTGTQRVVTSTDSTIGTVTAVTTVSTVTAVTGITNGFGVGANGPQKLEDVASAGGSAGIAAMCVRLDTPVANANVNADADFTNCLVDNMGKMWVAGVHAEDVASADGDRGMSMLCVQATSPASTGGTNLDYANVECSAGRIWVSATVDAALPTGTNTVGNVVLVPSATAGGTTLYTLTAANSTNATNVKASAGQVYSISGYTISATAAWLSLYNNAGTPTCGTSIIQQYLIPGSASGAGFNIDFSAPKGFATGIAFCITTGIAGTGSVAASSYVINIDYK